MFHSKSFGFPRSIIDFVPTCRFITHTHIYTPPNSYVGKTSIFQRAVDPKWKFTHEIKATIAISKPVMKRTAAGPIKLWDCGGQERFFNITSAFLRQADACIIVSSLDNTTSFDSASRWMSDIQNIVKCRQKEPIPVVFVINKIDLDKKSEFVMKDWRAQAEKISHKFKIPVYEVSALLNTGIQEMLEGVVVREKKMRHERARRNSSPRSLRRKSSCNSMIADERGGFCCVMS